MDWTKLKTFHAAAEAGSLTAAAEALGLSQSAASRQISALEKDLGVKLFHRHARGLRPTAQGQVLLQATHDIAHRVSVAETMVRDSRDQPAGDLHITAPLALGSILLAPRLGEFVAAYPDIRLHLELSDEETDLSSGHVQAALRSWRPEQPDLIQRRLMEVGQGVYASRGYLHAHGPITDARALDEHALIVYSGAARTPMHRLAWLTHEGRTPNAPRTPRLTVNTVLGVVSAVEAGLGLGSFPDYLARGSTDLVRVLPELRGPNFEIYFVYPAELRGSRRIAAFGAFASRWSRAWTHGAHDDEAA